MIKKHERLNIKFCHKLFKNKDPKEANLSWIFSFYSFVPKKNGQGLLEYFYLKHHNKPKNPKKIVKNGSKNQKSRIFF